MYVTMAAHPLNRDEVLIRFQAINIGGFFIACRGGPSHEFSIRSEWDAYTCCTTLMGTLMGDDENPIVLDLDGNTVRICPFLADQLFDRLFEFTDMKEPPYFLKESFNG
jgi:hypothetical protein